jgi:hypothetical protein
MTPIDIWAAVAAFVAASAIAIRARMLRPHERAWTQAPTCVWATLSMLGLALAMRAVSLAFGSHATAWEAMTDSMLALSSVALLWSLNRNGRAEHVRRQAIASEVEAVLQASGRPATYRWDGRRLG